MCVCGGGRGAAVVRQGVIATMVATKKQQGICVECTYISELMLWLHQRVKIVNKNESKYSSLAALKVAKYMRTMK